MPEYYLDIETNAKGSKPDIENDEILTVQFQRLGSVSGQKESDLTILKSWESSEEEILKKFHSIFQPSKPFEFIPIGMNLHFEFFMLQNRWRKFGLEIPLKTLIYDHPHIDIKPILVILNGGSFKGAILGKFTGKIHTGDKIPEWYANKDYAAIEKYVQDEAEGFVKFYQRLKEKIPVALQPTKSQIADWFEIWYDIAVIVREYPEKDLDKIAKMRYSLLGKLKRPLEILLIGMDDLEYSSPLLYEIYHASRLLYGTDVLLRCKNVVKNIRPIIAEGNKVGYHVW